MKKQEFIVKMLELGAELDKTEDGVRCNMIINDANILCDKFISSRSSISGHHPEIIISDVPPTKFQMFLYKLNLIKRNKEKRRVMKFYNETLTNKNE